MSVTSIDSVLFCPITKSCCYAMHSFSYQSRTRASVVHRQPSWLPARVWAMPGSRAPSSTLAVAIPTSVLVTADELANLGFDPISYIIKVCGLCGNHSASPSPFDAAEHQDVKAWGSTLPWGSGTLHKPRGEICRVCLYVFTHGGFKVIWPSIKEYIKRVKSHPEEHQEHCFQLAMFLIWFLNS